MGYQLPNDDICYQTMQDAENAFLVKLPKMSDGNGNQVAFSRNNSNNIEFNNKQIVLQLQNCDYEQSLMNHCIGLIQASATLMMVFIALLYLIKGGFSQQDWY